MELSKDDIKHIAYHRFNKSHQKHFYGMVFGGLALIIALMLAILKYRPESHELALAAAVAIVILMYIGLYLYSRAADKAAKSFLKECEANPTLTYVEELPRDVKKALD